MSRLSLESDSDSIREHSWVPSQRSSPSEWQQDPSDWESGEDDDEEEDTDIVTSPSGFRYNISRLSPRTKKVVKSLFRESPSRDPPQISLELCGIRQEDPHGNGYFYAFQLHETVPCSVRIGAKSSGRFAIPRCECPDARYRRVRPCKHLIWLFDRIAKQTLFDHDPDSELTLTEYGYPQELGDPFDQISQLRLDVLADALRCNISDPDSDSSPPSLSRLREAADIVASLAGIPPHEVPTPQPPPSSDRSLIHRGDLASTLISLLLASHSLTEWLRSALDPLLDPAVDPFRQIQHRVDRVLFELSSYPSSSQRNPLKQAEGPRNAPWAATQIQRCVKRIETLLTRSTAPLPPVSRASAAQALVHILRSVATHSDPELYRLLIGDAKDTSFAVNALALLPEQSQFAEDLAGVMEVIGKRGAGGKWAEEMSALVARMRRYRPPEPEPGTVGSASTVSAPSMGQTPPLNISPTAQSSPAPVQLTPSASSTQPQLHPHPSQPQKKPSPPPKFTTRTSTSSSSGGNFHFLAPITPKTSLTRGRGGRGLRGRGRGSTGTSRSSKTSGPRGGKRPAPGSANDETRIWDTPSVGAGSGVVAGGRRGSAEFAGGGTVERIEAESGRTSPKRPRGS
ncbi:uncharacterized protein CTHT_0056260 [Thermochaetoides thermophila DSM 1495]|uniref:SWIM-type domain-containing protein n=1 Tax=Chaetomium thermophilum (strain DSM 1495 / CBS 144.50 / IMI 039719) TaxID=759272 RepID=G0SC80_CHATD|nr:hypothetical protein CTHT_0056260 [Thermochaetoides thermophila DSM 1495]EGS19006.1 hypothetical protein CTHT_0056260 [Thermochaetoides thermophila DSM 1495]